MSWGGKAVFNGAVVLSEALACTVARHLPSGLSLLESPDKQRPAHHPLLFIFGEMVQGGAHVLGFSFSAGICYREVAVLAPFVRHAARGTPFLFSLQMLADNRTAVELGNAVYGYRKELAEIDTAGSAYACHLHGRSLFSGTGSVVGAWAPAARIDSGDLSWLRALVSMPVLGHRASGEFVRSSFDWDFSQASACRLDAEVQWNSPFGTLKAQSLAGRAVALRGLTWRTGPPQLLDAG